MKSRTTYITEFTIASSDKLIEFINNINEEDSIEEKKVVGYKRQPIRIFINSYGGSVYALQGMLSAIKISKTPIHTICLGIAMSCGIILLLSGHKRFIGSESTVMYHSISTITMGPIEFIKEDLQEAERLQNVLDNVVVTRCKIPKEKLIEIRKSKRDWFITAKEAIDLKIVDEYYTL